jgi:FtsP/CotA-like multicopper oxidase with cupredoxin domain
VGQTGLLGAAGLLLSLLSAVTANSQTNANSSPLAPPEWDAALKLPEPRDLNPDPQILEITLTAKLADVEVAGTKIRAWTYDGGLPGPLIRARVNDRLIVHFKNELPEPTTVHWHGVRVPIEMDGVPDISQPAVEKGQSFTYDFVLRDAGLYWYHPHVMSAAQVGFGLYGALLVEDPADGVGVADELTLVLSDIGFNTKGELEPPDSGGSAGMVFGREGTYVLANGKHHPVLRARAGASQRWRVVNAAKSRFFLLDLEGQSMTVIGKDGGLQEKPETKDAVLVTPGERVDLIVTPKGKPGDTLTLRALLYNRGYGSVEYRNDEDVLTVELSKDAPIAPAAPLQVSRTIVPPSAQGATAVPMKFTLPPVDAKGHSEFRINGAPHWKAKPFHAKIGETQLWTITNETEWDHPFHLHGYFFVVVDEQGEPIRPLAWKDTVNVPMKTTMSVLVAFDERPGEWMIHCHILDHAEGGLMGTVKVGDVKTTEHRH